MSVLIRGMEMPTKCADCLFIDYFKGQWYCHSINDILETGSSKRDERCNLFPIPPHGRLIDADALEKEAQKRMLICDKNGNQFQKPYEVMRAIALAPTIIEAEEGDT